MSVLFAQLLPAVGRISIFCFISSNVAIENPCCLPNSNVHMIIGFRCQWVFSISLAAADFVSCCFCTTYVLCVFNVFDDVCFPSCMKASLSVLSCVLTAVFVSKVLLFLMEVCVCVLLLRWLRVMVTLKVCACCSSILSSSDTLMKGHQANA